MSPELKAALNDLGVSVVHGVKILVTYILPSFLVALLLSPDFQHLFLAYPIVNTIWAIVADQIKNKLSDNKTVQKVL